MLSDTRERVENPVRWHLGLGVATSYEDLFFFYFCFAFSRDGEASLPLFYFLLAKWDRYFPDNFDPIFPSTFSSSPSFIIHALLFCFFIYFPLLVVFQRIIPCPLTA